MTGPFGTLGAPPDATSWVALSVAVLAVVAVRLRPDLGAYFVARPKRTVGILAATAFALSVGYVYEYLRGGPRIIDATSYFLQARSLASGFVAFPVPEPTGSFRGRFLLPTPAGDALTILFPPGYPLLLAGGFALGVPMLVGPAVGAGLVVITYQLAKRCSFATEVALLAALFSVVSAAARYHSADTMSHGWAALLAAGAICAALTPGRAAAIASGFALGWLLSTRPVTGLVMIAIALGCVNGGARRAWLVAAFAVGALPLLYHQHVATGRFWESVQLAYYSVADGPPGCFALGFGKRIGCQVEHGEFVAHNLADGYGAWAALKTTARRLAMHRLDAGNLEVFLLVAGWAAWRGRTETAVRRLAIVVVGLILAYAPFYFDGNYPGGGARFYFDGIAFEQVLAAWGMIALRAGRFVLPLSLGGFACHASFDHAQLANREGGRPMFESERLEAAGVRSGLLFVDTDHGFNLGFEPAAPEGVAVARFRGDAHDWLLWQRLGRPPSYRYRFDVSGATAPEVVPYRVPYSERFEVEAEWPPLAVDGGWAKPVFAPCASRGRGLELLSESASVELSVESAAPRAGTYRVRIGYIGRPASDVSTRFGEHDLELGAPSATECPSSLSQPVSLAAASRRVTLRAAPGTAIDFVELVPAASASLGAVGRGPPARAERPVVGDVPPSEKALTSH